MARSSDGDDGTVLVSFEVDASPVADRLGPDVMVTMSGDRAELGSWVGHALGLVDDGCGMDRVAGDGVHTATVRLEAGGTVSYKYLLGDPADPSWEGVELDGAVRRGRGRERARAGGGPVRELRRCAARSVAA